MNNDDATITIQIDARTVALSLLFSRSYVSGQAKIWYQFSFKSFKDISLSRHVVNKAILETKTQITFKVDLAINSDLPTFDVFELKVHLTHVCTQNAVKCSAYYHIIVRRRSSITMRAARISRERFDLESPNVTQTSTVHTDLLYNRTGHNITNYFRSEVRRKNSKMSPPMASGGISRERFKR